MESSHSIRCQLGEGGLDRRPGLISQSRGIRNRQVLGGKRGSDRNRHRAAPDDPGSRQPGLEGSLDGGRQDRQSATHGDEERSVLEAQKIPGGGAGPLGIDYDRFAPGGGGGRVLLDLLVDGSTGETVGGGQGQ